eukprot:1158491-Pelagomonas_calceolata.AAC.2
MKHERHCLKACLSCHGTAVSCHERVVSCHERVISCHGTVVSCHGTAVSCHTTPVSCHGTAVSCHTTPASCHATAVSCHTTPASCHATAVSCHGTAASCHGTTEDIKLCIYALIIEKVKVKTGADSCKDSTPQLFLGSGNKSCLLGVQGRGMEGNSEKKSIPRKNKERDGLKIIVHLNPEAAKEEDLVHTWARQI